MLSKIAIILILICNIPSISFAAKRTSDAILCSSIYYIVTSMTEGNKAGQEMLMKQQEIFNLIYASKQKRSVSNGEINELQHQHLMYLSDLYDKNPSKVYNLEMQCSTWRETFVPSLMQLSKTAKNLEQLKRGMRKFPPMGNKTFKRSDPRWAASKSMMDLSFESWSQNGRVTPYSIKQNLLNSLKKKN